MLGIVRVIRSGGIFGASWIWIYPSDCAESAGCPGKSEAICPSGHSQKIAISGVPIISEYSRAFTSGIQRQRNWSNVNQRGFKNVSQTYVSLRSKLSAGTQRSSTKHQRRRVASILFQISTFQITEAYHPSRECPPGRAIVTVFCVPRSVSSVEKNQSVISE